MSDSVVEFPERRDVIPVNLPDIPNLLMAVPCMCGVTSFTLMATKESGVMEAVCNACKLRMRLRTPTFLDLPEETA